MAIALLDIANLASDATFQLKIKAALADKAQAILVDVNATAEQKAWARHRFNNSELQVDTIALYCAAVSSVTAGSTDSALKAHVAAAVANLTAPAV